MIAYNNYKKTTRKGKCVKVHRLIVEKILGKSISSKIEIHHLDFDRSNNSNANLIVCPNKSYHQLLHRRQEVLMAGFDPWKFHKCTDCKKFLENENFSNNKTRASGLNNLCKHCDSIRQKKRYARID